MPVDKTMKILIVDDFKTMLRIIDGQLRALGFQNIDEAPDGETALRLIKQNQYGLVLSDWNMQPMNGLELVKAVRAEPGKKNLPVILITAESKIENIIAAKQAGVNNYVVKPFNGTTLKEKMSAVIGAF